MFNVSIEIFTPASHLAEAPNKRVTSLLVKFYYQSL